VPIDGNAAIAGEDLMVYQIRQTPGEQSEVRLSKPVTEQGGPVVTVGAPCKSGQLLKADSLGRGIPAVNPGDSYGAIAWQKATAANQVISCSVVIGQIG